jgi:outer membrane protein TolC
LQAELSNVDGELIRMEQMRAAAQADLAQVLHISPETPLAAVDQLSPENVPRDLDWLYRQAVASRPELHAMLAEIERDQRMVDLARLEYYPDATFTFGWGEMTTNRALAPSADGIDNLTVGVSVNLPVYRKRLDAAVREAEATVVASARQYDQMKDETQRDVKQLFTQAASQRDVEVLFRESIIPKTRQALEVAVRGYQVRDTEFADLIANWRELLRFHISHLKLEAQLRQTLASLERVVGGLPAAPPEEPQPLPPPQ